MKSYLVFSNIVYNSAVTSFESYFISSMLHFRKKQPKKKKNLYATPVLLFLKTKRNRSNTKKFLRKTLIIIIIKINFKLKMLIIDILKQCIYVYKHFLLVLSDFWTHCMCVQYVCVSNRYLT